MKWLAILLCVLLACTGCGESEKMTGTGTALDPYIITTRADLEAVNDHLDAYYELGADISLVGSDWIPLGTFTGSFDGKHKRISGMTITTPATYTWSMQGLFSEVSGTFKDMSICNASIVLRSDGTNDGYPWGVGFLAGSAIEGFSADGITVSGVVTKNGVGRVAQIGGLIGYWYPSSNVPIATQTITNCRATLRVTAINGTAGSYLDGVGGVVGYSDAGGSATITISITDCVSSLSVSGDATLELHYVGGIIGYVNTPVIISGCVVTADVVAPTSNSDSFALGGVVGSIQWTAAITDCRVSGKVWGGVFLGGFIGEISNHDDSALITRCSADTDVKGDVECIGGFTGGEYVNAPIVYTDCYAIGDVESTRADNNNGVAGFSGSGKACTYVRCYSAGKVAVVDEDLYATGGFNGYAAESTTSCYWDTETSGQARGVDAAGKTTAQMKTQSTFTGWDFDTTWNIASGTYPFLRTAFVTVTDGCVPVAHSFPWVGRFSLAHVTA